MSLLQKGKYGPSLLSAFQIADFFNVDDSGCDDP